VNLPACPKGITETSPKPHERIFLPAYNPRRWEQVSRSKNRLKERDERLSKGSLLVSALIAAMQAGEETKMETDSSEPTIRAAIFAGAMVRPNEDGFEVIKIKNEWKVAGLSYFRLLNQ